MFLAIYLVAYTFLGFGRSILVTWVVTIISYVTGMRSTTNMHVPRYDFAVDVSTIINAFGVDEATNVSIRTPAYETDGRL